MNRHLLQLIFCAGLICATSVLAVRYQQAHDFDEWIYWLIWFAMTLHHCEEHVFTELVLGKRRSFFEWTRQQGFDISPWRSFVLNCGIGWSLAILAGILGDQFILIPLFVIAVETINAFWHLSVTSLQGRWAPGTLSGVLITVPAGFYLFQNGLDHTPAISCLAVFIAACLAHHAFLRELPRVQPGAAYIPSAESQLLRHSDHRQARVADASRP